MCVYDSGAVVRHAGPSKAGAATSADEEVDPRLKNFEPRMVELIISEVTNKPLTTCDQLDLNVVHFTVRCYTARYCHDKSSMSIMDAS